MTRLVLIFFFLLFLVALFLSNNAKLVSGSEWEFDLREISVKYALDLSIEPLADLLREEDDVQVGEVAKTFIMRSNEESKKSISSDALSPSPLSPSSSSSLSLEETFPSGDSLNKNDKNKNQKKEIFRLHTPHHTTFDCALPSVQLLLETPSQTKHDRATLSAKLVSEYFERLPKPSSACISLAKGWWSYKLCMKESITQFPTKPQSRKSPPLINILGNFSHVDDNGAHVFLNGSLCTETGKPRRASVNFRCGESPEPAISRIDEPETCTYLFLVTSHQFCPKVSNPTYPIHCGLSHGLDYDYSSPYRKAAPSPNLSNKYLYTRGQNIELIDPEVSPYGASSEHGPMHPLSSEDLDIKRGDEFQGMYTCGGEHSFSFRVFSLDNASPARQTRSFMALVRFQHSSGSVGTFVADGDFNKLSRKIVLHPKRWIERPGRHFYLINLVGSLSFDGQAISGVSPDCGYGPFKVTRTKLASTTPLPFEKLECPSEVPPFSTACLTNVWLDAGCRMDGNYFPGHAPDYQLAFWNNQDIYSVYEDIALYALASRQGEPGYTANCWGSKVDRASLPKSHYSAPYEDYLLHVQQNLRAAAGTPAKPTPSTSSSSASAGQSPDSTSQASTVDAGSDVIDIQQKVVGDSPDVAEGGAAERVVFRTLDLRDLPADLNFQDIDSEELEEEVRRLLGDSLGNVDIKFKVLNVKDLETLNKVSSKSKNPSQSTASSSSARNGKFGNPEGLFDPSTLSADPFGEYLDQERSEFEQQEYTADNEDSTAGLSSLFDQNGNAIDLSNFDEKSISQLADALKELLNSQDLQSQFQEPSYEAQLNDGTEDDDDEEEEE